MKSTLKNIVAASIAAIALNANAEVLTFDDIDTSFSVVQLSQNYGGLNWDYSSDWSLGWQVWYTSQSSYPAQSSPNVAFAHSTNLGVSFLADSVFEGAYFGGTSQVRYELYNDNTLVYSSAFSGMGNSGNPAAWVGSGYSGLVDRVQVITNGSGSDWVMDNFTYTPPVPEPETYAMMMAGLGLLGFMAKRKKSV